MVEMFESENKKKIDESISVEKCELTVLKM